MVLSCVQRVVNSQMPSAQQIFRQALAELRLSATHCTISVNSIVAHSRNAVMVCSAIVASVAIHLMHLCQRRSLLLPRLCLPHLHRHLCHQHPRHQHQSQASLTMSCHHVSTTMSSQQRLTDSMVGHASLLVMIRESAQVMSLKEPRPHHSVLCKVQTANRIVRSAVVSILGAQLVRSAKWCNFQLASASILTRPTMQ